MLDAFESFEGHGSAHGRPRLSQDVPGNFYDFTTNFVASFDENV
jgi:hypothetical protein